MLASAFFKGYTPLLVVTVHQRMSVLESELRSGTERGAVLQPVLQFQGILLSPFSGGGGDARQRRAPQWVSDAGTRTRLPAAVPGPRRTGRRGDGRRNPAGV